MNKTLLLDKDQFIVCEKGKKNILKSQYLETYIKNSKQIMDRNEWKTTGINAQFRQDYHPVHDLTSLKRSAKINGAAFISDRKSIIYSALIENQSALLIRNIDDDGITEGHVTHDGKTLFHNLDYNRKSGQTAIAVSQESFERHLALIEKDQSSFRIITEGETIEDNPCWDRGLDSILYYDCAGIGKDHQGNMTGIGSKVINRLNLQTGDLDEIVAIHNYDCFMPKTDYKGYLYFIKKPNKEKRTNPLAFFDFLLIPFKIVHAIYKYLEFFTMRYTGKTFNTAGSNPAKSKPVNEKELFIQGNLINARKNEKKNQSKGEKFPGYVPPSWQLMKRDFDGNITMIKKGVIAFDITSDNEIIYSNGKYVVKIDQNGTEEKIDAAETIEKLIALS